MDWSKLDAALAAAVAEDPGTRRLAVFVHVVPGVDPVDLQGAGLEGGEGSIRTADVSADELARLSEQSWVIHLRLSRALGLAGGI